MPEDFKKLSDKIGQVIFPGGKGVIENLVIEGQEQLTPTKHIPRGSVHFVGRETELTLVHEDLQGGDDVAISGMGGVGKTELATQYAKQYQNNYGGIIWFNDRASNLAAEVLSFFIQLGFKIPQEQGGRLLTLKEQVAWCWLQYPKADLPILIVFDDVTSLDNLGGVVPRDKRFRVLVTTRLRNLDPNLIQEIPLDVLSPEKALELLKQLLGKDKRVDNQPKTANAICKFLEYLPLGIELVGAYLAQDPDLHLYIMLERLQQRKLAEAALQDRETLNSTQLGVKAAFALTWEELEPPTQQLGRFLSLFAPQSILWDLVVWVATGGDDDPSPNLSPTGGEALIPPFSHREGELGLGLSPDENNDSSPNLPSTEGEALIPPFPRREGGLGGLGLPDEINEAKKQLYKRHLLQQVEDSEGYYKIHALVRWFLQEQLANAGEIKPVLETTFATAMIKVAKLVPQSPTSEDIESISVVIPHIEDLGERIIAEVNQAREQQINSPASVLNDEVLWIFEGVARFYQGQGLYQLAEDWYKECVKVCQALFSGDHFYVATSLNNLAFLYDHQGRYSEAEPLYIEALTMTKRLFTGDHLNVATSLNNLASLYDHQGRYSEAEPLYIEALTMTKRLFTGDHLDVARSLNNLAFLYKSQGRYSDAESLYIKALAMIKRLFTYDYPYVATSLNNLAYLYDSQGRYSEAEPLYMEALAMKKRLFTYDHPDVATSLNNLAGFYKDQGQYSEAEPLLIEALAMRKRLFTGDHPDVAGSLNNLAGFYKDQGQYSEAEPLLIEALAMRKRLFTGDHPDVAGSLNNLAGFYKDQGQYSEAEPLLIEALAMRKRLFTGDHPDVAGSLNNLAVLYNNQGRYSEAEPLYMEALAMRKRLFTGDHPDLATSLNNLAEFYRSQGQYSEAEPLYIEALAMLQRVLGDNHPNVASSLNNLAVLYNNQGRYSEAELLQIEALAMKKRLFTGDHPDVASSLNNLAELYRSQGRYSEAEPLYIEALAMFQRVLGDNHPNTVTVRENLAILQRQLTPVPIWQRWLSRFFQLLLVILILPFYLLWQLAKKIIRNS
ncbi:tetratricopeptide repeat protein [Nostoc sp. FACHB-190]|uniref:tetratricopeptide repeat protein n=1 Tax=Nostoc sp. FACHB-190 TaxID=2692838 RepID=UPI001682DE12|nr:tetratricopeptide repeat protein [Nostoc sp. FACHB-190]MBD2301925.1 tetratricopeptide repeat protein [Nostoc sp. FACHB-190]